MRSCALTRHDALASWGPMCRVLYRLLVSLARLAVRSGRSKDLEIIVLRHQLAVLHRQYNRAALANEDRALLGAIAAASASPGWHAPGFALSGLNARGGWPNRGGQGVAWPVSLAIRRRRGCCWRGRRSCRLGGRLGPAPVAWDLLTFMRSPTRAAG